ncbi:MAG: AgmX/PglI C-terminal domain-containing protein [Polyangiaceae bacterium]|jgi:outer membrane biosynthesis protein TonB
MKTTSGFLVLASLVVACGGGSQTPAATPASSPASTATPSSSTDSTSGGGNVTAGASTASAPIADAEKVIGNLKPDIRKCYNDALAKDPSLAGSVMVKAQIDAKGAVSSATPAGTPTLPADLVTCITTQIQKAQFSPPGAGGSTIQIPLKFEKGS